MTPDPVNVSNVEINPARPLDTAALHALLNASYAFMADRIDPPSSLTEMTEADIGRKADREDVLLIRDDARIVACGFGHGEGTAYEMGKLAVAASHRRRGLARMMIESACALARARGHSQLQLFARVELTENHAIYRSLGFEVAGHFTHPGFDRPTALLFRRAL